MTLPQFVRGVFPSKSWLIPTTFHPARKKTKQAPGPLLISRLVDHGWNSSPTNQWPRPRVPLQTQRRSRPVAVRPFHSATSRSLPPSGGFRTTSRASSQGPPVYMIAHPTGKKTGTQTSNKQKPRLFFPGGPMDVK